MLRVPISGQQTGKEEADLIMEVANSQHYGGGVFTDRFERGFAQYMGARHAILCNSGSSALLLALSALELPKGSRILTPAVGFPTTVNAIIQCGHIPVFIDSDPRTLNMVSSVELDFSIRAVVVAHTLGNPVDLLPLVPHGIPIVEDCCFVARTLVPTKKGTKYISDIVPGDKVLGFNGKTFLETEVVGVDNRLVPQSEILAIYFEGKVDSGGSKTVRCTNNHKFFVKGEWVRADQLSVGDEVYHSTWSEYVSWRRREYKVSDAGRKKISERMKRNNPMKNSDTVVKAASSRKWGKLSHHEKRVLEVIKENNLPIKYTGDFSFWVGDKDSGRKNPDFLFEEKKIVYEVYDPTFRYDKGFRDNKWQQERAGHYERFGYRTVFLPLKGWINTVEKENLAVFLRSTLSNGIKIKRIAPVKKVKQLNLAAEPKGYVRVYDIKCAPYSNFCLTGGILVHNCDAIGSTIHGRMVGRVGVMSTASFYPAHHITMGEGGAVLTDSPRLKKIIESYRDWGRDCFCAPGCDNTCGTRYDGDYDHKYSYSRIGYNLKANDFSAAAGVAQLDRLDGFGAKRRENYKYLYDALKDLPIKIVEATPDSDPSWFGFPFLTDRRNELARYLDKHSIGNRPVMGGNLTRQPAYRSVEYQVIGNLSGANLIHEKGLWLGCFPGITFDMLDYVIEKMKGFYNV